MAPKESRPQTNSIHSDNQPNDSNPKECFIIMPISDPDGYAKDHFKHVYCDIVEPACLKAGFRAVRADDVKQTNLIHLDVLQKLN